MVNSTESVPEMAMERLVTDQQKPVDVTDSAAMAGLRGFAESLGLPWTAWDRRDYHFLGACDASMLPVLPRMVTARLSLIYRPEVCDSTDDFLFCIVPVPAEVHPDAVLVGFALPSRTARPQFLLDAAREAGWGQARFDAWLDSLPVGSPGLIERLIRNVSRIHEMEHRDCVRNHEITSLLKRYDHACSELDLLHGLTRNLQVSYSPHDLAELCLHRLHVRNVAACQAIVLEDEMGQVHYLVEGNRLFDEFGLARLLSRFEHHDWKRPLIRNHVSQSLLGADFPGLESFVAAPICRDHHRQGWILSLNSLQDREFTVLEANLLSSIATILANHLRNLELFNENGDLLVSFVRSLVSTLDAKDPYTRGHSERVALIARRLGTELGLPEADLEDIYLSGLLHDIGKIGVDDRILRKPDQLTPDEFRQIQEHPIIGYQILSTLQNLKPVLPGVRSHHEAWNGTGYPDGLVGEQIPLIARIIAVADAFDAMGSDRPYRAGMAIQKLEQIFRQGAGSQWDPRIVEAYFSVRDDIQEIVKGYTPEQGNLLPAHLEPVAFTGAGRRRLLTEQSPR